MSAERWVQHMSGKGEKWLLISGPLITRTPTILDDEWAVCKDNRNTAKGYLILPKSEYRLCEPPEVWVDVTAECEVGVHGAIFHNGRPTVGHEGYRRRKAQLYKQAPSLLPVWAFIVEKKRTEMNTTSDTSASKKLGGEKQRRTVVSKPKVSQ